MSKIKTASPYTYSVPNDTGTFIKVGHRSIHKVIERVKIGDYIASVGTVFEIQPYRNRAMAPFEADARALREDMQVVGRDLVKAIENERRRRAKAAG